MKTQLIILLTLCFIACDKSEERKSGLVGKWRLVEQYVSTGGPGTWRQASSEKPQFVVFENSGILRYVPENLHNAKSYRITSDSTLIMIRGTDEFYYRYKLGNKQLELYPPCIEGCGARYVAVDK